MEKAYFGGGCFWCLDAVYQRVDGVEKVVPGYSGGETTNPTYEEVSAGDTGHAEVVEITFNPNIVTYEQLLEVFWTIHDPTTQDRQGNDVGSQYRSIILFASDDQEKTIRESLDGYAKELWGEKITTEVKPLEFFVVAEEYHHDYFNKNPANSYCQIVINPKLSKFAEKHSELMKNQ